MTQPLSLCITEGCKNPAINPDIGIDICEDCNAAYKRPRQTGFWGVPWGWLAIGFWIAMVIKNMMMSALPPSFSLIILLGLIDITAIVCLILKVIKAVRTRRG